MINMARLVPLFALALCFAATSLAKRFPGCDGGTLVGCPGSNNCSVNYFEQPLDHFDWYTVNASKSKSEDQSATYMQRYFVYDKYAKPGGPIFFYFGNEDNVELYVNHTGLMWENAEDFGATMVFAEHRYYGESLPLPAGTPNCMRYLTSEQAMADFARLIDHLTGGRPPHGPAVVGFGGSYGGMIGAWFKMKYPNSVDGVVAASAPIWSFSGLSPPYDFDAFNEVVTRDATAAGGATDACAANLKQAWPRILKAGETAEGRQVLAKAFRTCAPVTAASQAMAFVGWAQGVWGTLAMGNYPYASSYLLHGKSLLPPWPVRAACAAGDPGANLNVVGLAAPGSDDAKLFAAVRAAAAVMHNNTGAAKCFPITGGGNGGGAVEGVVKSESQSHTKNSWRMVDGIPPSARWAPRQPASSPPLPGAAAGPAPTNRASSCQGDWDFQWCTEMVQPFTQGTSKDMFYCPPKEDCSKWDFAGAAQNCRQTWGVTPRPGWARFGLLGKHIQGTSNIVFSNGLLDPWSRGGVLANVSDSLVAVQIPNGAHHIDLMFSTDEDAKYPDIIAARALEVAEMRKWVAQAAAAAAAAPAPAAKRKQKVS